MKKTRKDLIFNVCNQQQEQQEQRVKTIGEKIASISGEEGGKAAHRSHAQPCKNPRSEMSPQGCGVEDRAQWHEGLNQTNDHSSKQIKCACWVARKPCSSCRREVDRRERVWAMLLCQSQVFYALERWATFLSLFKWIFEVVDFFLFFKIFESYPPGIRRGRAGPLLQFYPFDNNACLSNASDQNHSA